MNRRDILNLAGLSALAAATFEIAHSGPQVLAGTSESSMPGNSALNQVGFLPTAQKIASIPSLPIANPAFQVFTAREYLGQKPVFQGTLTAPMQDEASGDRISLADFSQMTTPGEYTLAVDGKRSQSFSIAKSVYHDPLRLAMRAFYGQRCGCAVDLGNGYRHPACHLAGAYHPTSGRQGNVANHGGWHDAGDYGRYVVNSGISTGTLLWAWELYPQALQSLHLNIPESGGKLPDYLAEVKWNLDWMLSLQDNDGGVWHKQTSEQFCAFIMPQDDSRISYVIGTGESPYKSTCATADLAGVAAIAARCYSPYDPAFAALCLAAAKRAFAWAVAHPDVTFTNPLGIGTGGYDDRHCNDEILWAAAELYRTTGESQFEQAFLAGTEALPPETSIAAPGWGNLAPMAYWTYALADRKPSSESVGKLRAQILQQTADAAEKLITRQKTSGYGNTLALHDYGWGSNSTAANQSLLLLIANHFAPRPATLEAALGNLHYLLGRNCFGISWVTQVGTNPFQNPHHRPSAADHIAAPWPGLLSGGPNAHPGDAIARTLPQLPPMRMWLDNQAAYSLNEIAINWNAPLVFLLAAAHAQSL